MKENDSLTLQKHAVATHKLKSRCCAFQRRSCYNDFECRTRKKMIVLLFRSMLLPPTDSSHVVVPSNGFHAIMISNVEHERK